jgi:hypothetical protein
MDMQNPAEVRAFSEQTRSYRRYGQLMTGIGRAAKDTTGDQSS